MSKVTKRISNAGFTLVAALFLLVVVALLSVYMINFSGVQHTTLVYGMQGARAMQAARAGIEWGVYEAITNNNTNGICQTTPVTTTFQVDGFSVQVDCSLSAHAEGATTITTYKLTSEASINSFGSLDYVFRSLQASVSNQPP